MKTLTHTSKLLKVKDMSKKLIILSIVLLTSLSATFLNKLPSTEETKNAAQETETAKKIKSFDAKNYLQEYEHQKNSKRMLNESLKRGTNL
jgi:uncharacterized membrane protein